MKGMQEDTTNDRPLPTSEGNQDSQVMNPPGETCAGTSWRPLITGIDELLGHWDWTVKPWFLEQIPAFERWGLSKNDLTTAVGGLARLYPPSYCRKTLESTRSDLTRCISTDVATLQRAGQNDASKLAESAFERVRIVWPLYHPPAPSPPVEFMTRGIDADLVHPDQVEPKLIDRLRHPDELAGAALELEVWASLLRAGQQVTRFAPSDRRERRHDLLVPGIEGGLLLEVKDLRLPDDELAFWRHEMPASNALFQAVTCLPQDLHVEVCLADEIAEMNLDKNRRKALPGELDGAIQKLVDTILQLEAAGWPVTDRVVAGAGTVRVRARRDDGEGPLTPFLLARQHAEFHARRLLNPIKEAAKKGTRFLPAVVFVDVPSEVDHELAAKTVEREIAERPGDFASLDGIIVRSSRRHVQSTPGTHWITWVHRLRGGRLSRSALQRLSDDIVRNTRRQSLWVGARMQW
jgi:hypothetical protein